MSRLAGNSDKAIKEIRDIANDAASPKKASSPHKDTMKEAAKEVTQELKQQLCSRILWTYLILGLILLAVCFYFFATAKADVQQYIGTRPDGFPSFVDNPWFIYVVISVVGVLFVYGMYRAYMAAGHSTAKYMLNIVFAVICTLIIIWFYQFYRLGKLNAQTDSNTGYGNRVPFFIAVALLVLLVLQFFLMWNTGDRLAAYTTVPLLVVIALFTWASWELSTGTSETF